MVGKERKSTEASCIDLSSQIGSSLFFLRINILGISKLHIQDNTYVCLAMSLPFFYLLNALRPPTCRGILFVHLILDETFHHSPFVTCRDFDLPVMSTYRCTRELRDLSHTLVRRISIYTQVRQKNWRIGGIWEHFPFTSDF